MRAIGGAYKEKGTCLELQRGQVIKDNKRKKTVQNTQKWCCESKQHDKPLQDRKNIRIGFNKEGR